MDLKLNDDQNMLKKVAADFVKSEAPSYVITEWYQKKQAFIPELYKKTAEVGWLGMTVPEEFGGGGTWAWTARRCSRNWPRAATRSLFFLRRAGGTVDYRRRFGGAEECLAAEDCDASAVIIPAISDDPMQFGPRSVQTRAFKSSDGYRFQGTKRFVQDGSAASHFIVAARDEVGQVVLALVERNAPGVR